MGYWVQMLFCMNLTFSGTVGGFHDGGHVGWLLSPNRYLCTGLGLTNLQLAYERILVVGSTHATDTVLTRLLIV